MAKAKRGTAELLIEAARALGMAQREFGTALGASARTASRWHAGESTPSPDQMRALVALLVPKQRALAEEIAAQLGETLPSPASADVATAAPKRSPAREDLVDIVLCAVANQAGAVPNTLRPLLYTAFRRAREVGLTVEDVEKALTPSDDEASRG